jgi:beta-lactamase class A
LLPIGFSVLIYQMNKRILFIVLGVSIALNVFFGYLFIQNKSLISPATGTKEENKVSDLQAKYPYLSKRILIENPNDVLINFLPLRTQLEGIAKPWEKEFSMYFEYLPTGTNIGINRDDQFFAASLFKVPVIMAYYHFINRTGEVHDQEFTIKEEDIDTQFGNLWKKGVGIKINGEEAVRLALEESDNTAAKAIARQVGQEDFDDVYSALGLDLLTGAGGAIMTTREYATILKSLYFSAVLDKEDSNEILQFLTKSKFDDKLVAGVGGAEGDIPIAHKIGDYRDSKGEKAFYDCGIVFIPKRNYLLCMSSVGDETAANIRMSQISKAVYEYVIGAEK